VTPALALLAGLMPLRSTGVEQFRATHPTYDGRSVLIGILDSGIDPGVQGLITTSTGAPKVLDVRDFSGEGAVALTPVTPGGDGTVAVQGRTLNGAARIGRLTTGRWFGGVLRELPLGTLPAADLNGNGSNTDAYPVVVVKASDGWVAFIDSNLNGSFEDEMPLHDYRQGRETIAFGSKPITLAANLSDSAGVPALDFVFDNSGHGTHVAGIAAGHAMFGITEFDGAAPGAQLLGLKIANDARGGISVSGSMAHALDYAARFAAERGLPLVLNLSFGVGNEQEGRAVIDSIVNTFLLAHPDVVLNISAGNDGPGLSTMGFPASADLALSVGALLPGAFTREPEPGPPPPDVMGWWSSRGGELAKPDFLTPGEAFSTVPRWNAGDEDKTGTSMAAPQSTGLVACLLSALKQENNLPDAADVGQALRVTATPVPGWTVLDQGAGVPKLDGAYHWLVAGHQGSRYIVRTTSGGSAAFRRSGLSGPDDTTQTFRVTHADGLRAAQFELRSDAPWLVVAPSMMAGARTTDITVAYRPDLLQTPGVYVGRVTVRNPSDTLAGALFQLINTVIIPTDLGVRPLADPRRTLTPTRTYRYFLGVPAPGMTLHVAVTLADSTQGILLKLHEPNGQPARGAAGEDTPVGFGRAARGELTVPGEDGVAGVYELDLTALAPAFVTVAVRAEVGAVALNPHDGGFEVSNVGAGSVALRGATTLVGAGKDIDVAGRGLAAESIVVTVPTWAAHAVIDVQMPTEQWNWFTDFGVTVYDAAGQQVNSSPLNYAFGRQSFDIPRRLGGQQLLVELFPGFARADAPHRWHASVRVRFLLAAPQHVADIRDLLVVAGGRSALTAPSSTPALPLPDGFHPVVEWTLSPAGGTADSSGSATVVGRRTLENP
jgi:subtilisin family serine protease